MKNILLTVFAFIVIPIYAQVPISSNRIAGSSIVLNNLSWRDLNKIMQGTIFDVFNLDLSSSEYNTDLKRLTFLETTRGKEYQQRLEGLRNRLINQGIKTIPLSQSSTNRDYITTISDYDVNKRGFSILIGYNEDELSRQRVGLTTTMPIYTNIINGFKIPNKVFPFFMPVPVNMAQKIERNKRAVVQLQLAVDSFAIQKIFIINSDTLEIYAEINYEESPSTEEMSTEPVGNTPNEMMQRLYQKGYRQ